MTVGVTRQRRRLPRIDSRWGLTFALIVHLAIARPTAADSPDLLSLQSSARSADGPAAIEAIRKLEQAGQTSGLAELARGLMGRDAGVIDKAVAGLDPVKVKGLEAELSAARAKALANLQKLEKAETVALAKQHHAKLKELLARLAPANAARSQIIDALRRRAECGRVLDRLGVERKEEAGEAAILTRAGRALGMDAAAAVALPELGDVNEPASESPEYPLWLYRAARRIETYNKTQAETQNKWEMTSVRLLNEYRECLGVMPLEIDPRLSQAARRHSKEMCDLNYFNHTSPTAGQESPLARMRSAGYMAGYRENICANVGDPQRAFEVWFNSPGHHLAMVAAEEVAIGCGRWDNAWTHTFGHGLRLMFKDPTARAEALKVMTEGTIAVLKPQPDNAKLPGVTVTRVETDITIIDPKTGKRVTVPGSK